MGKKDGKKDDDPDDKAWGGDTNQGQCKRCGGSGSELVNGQRYDCRQCGGSGKA